MRLRLRTRVNGASERKGDQRLQWINSLYTWPQCITSDRYSVIKGLRLRLHGNETENEPNCIKRKYSGKVHVP